ncbi:MAG: nucleotide exchange factor GrpE [candidate division NC10 bacterium]|nr:nucleotide exchange factor GrpE [candidate division NC10 bacterium]
MSLEGKASGLVIRQVTISQREYNELKKQKELARRYQRRLIKLEAELARLQKEKEGETKLIREILPVVDDFERAIKAGQRGQDCGAILEGLQAIHREVLQVFQRKGVERFESRGERFDPARHQLLEEPESLEGLLKAVVIEELRPGYKMGGQIIRKALVRLGRDQE